MLSPTENHLKMIDANVFVLMFSFIIARDFYLKHNSKVPVCFKLFVAHPPFLNSRIQGLMQKFQQNQLPVKSVYAEYLHFVE